MKLYRTKIPTIAREIIDRLVEDGDVEILAARREEAEKDLIAVMEEFIRRDNDFRNRVRDGMANRAIPYDQYGSVRKKLAEEENHPAGDEIDRYLARQFIENLMISPHVDEVFGEDEDIRRKIMIILKSHDVDERAIREEAEAKVKNVREGTMEYEVALQHAMREVKKRRGLLDDRERNDRERADRG